MISAASQTAERNSPPWCPAAPGCGTNSLSVLRLLYSYECAGLLPLTALLKMNDTGTMRNDVSHGIYILNADQAVLQIAVLSSKAPSSHVTQVLPRHSYLPPAYAGRMLSQHYSLDYDATYNSCQECPRCATCASTEPLCSTVPGVGVPTDSNQLGGRHNSIT